MMIPETIDDLLAAMENPHIPIEEKMAKEDDDYVHFKDEDGAAEAANRGRGKLGSREG